jgi:hypothetical protein
MCVLAVAKNDKGLSGLSGMTDMNHTHKTTSSRGILDRKLTLGVLSL